MKIAFLGGGGAMGGLFGGYLARSGEDVILVDVSQASVDVINRDGLTIEEKDGSTETVHVKASSRPAEVGPVDLARRFEDCGVAVLIYTDIARDGALSGIDAAAVADLARQIQIPVIASGGVSTLADIAALKAHEADGIVGIICGRAFYDGRIDPRAALRLVEEPIPC